MRWPRRRWAVTQYYYGVADGVVRRTWTERAANRTAARRQARIDRMLGGLSRAYSYRVGRREPW